MSGFRATVVVDDPAGCPVAELSSTTENGIDSVSRTRPIDGQTVVEEVSVEANAAVDGVTNVELTPVQANDQEAIYRFERDAGIDCACELIESTGTPISSVRAQNGSLLLSFRTLELEAVSEVVDQLRGHFDGVIVEELTQDHERASGDPVIVDRDVLTDRQREILEAAHEMGYFTYPKGANASEVADELGVARSTFTEHLAAAQTKLLDAMLES